MAPLQRTIKHRFAVIPEVSFVGIRLSLSYEQKKKENDFKGVYKPGCSVSGLYAPRETDFQWGPTTPTYLIHVPVKPVSPSSIIYSISVPDSGNPRNPAIFISCARPRMHVCFCERWWHSVLLPDLKIENTYSVVPSPARESRPFFRTMSENKLPRRAPLGSCCA